MTFLLSLLGRPCGGEAPVIVEMSVGVVHFFLIC